MDHKKGDILTKVLVVILVILILVVSIVFIINRKNLDTNSSLVTDLYNYLGQNDLTFCDGLGIYREEKTSYYDIDNSSRLCNTVASLYVNEKTTLMKVDKTKKNNTCSIGDGITFATDNYSEDFCTVNRVEKNSVKDTYKKIYGKDLEKDESFTLNNTTICYPDDEYYYCGLSETFTVSVGNEPKTYRSIKKALKKDDKIIIDDYFIKVTNNECFTSYTGKTLNNTCTDALKNNDNIDYKFIKKYGTLYRHTYQKNDNGDYYWLETDVK